MIHPYENQYGDIFHVENSDFHNTKGPAVIWSDGKVEWWVDGVQYLHPLVYQVAAGLSDEEMVFLMLKYNFK